MAGIKAASAEVSVPAGSVNLNGTLVVPEGARSIILFSHAGGSSHPRFRNAFAAQSFQRAGFATLAFDLLTSGEDKHYSSRFEIELLVQRLLLVTDWVNEKEETGSFDIGYFGTGTGAAAALGAASMLGSLVGAVVSRGGRPDLAIPYLSDVKAATLLIVGSLDRHMIDLNHSAFSFLGSTKELRVLDGASNMFEEPGKQEEVAKAANEWFGKYLKGPQS